MRSIFNTLPINVRAVLHDMVMGAASFLLALYLRLGSRTLSYTAGYLLPATLAFALVLLVVLLHFRTYRRVWRYTSLGDLLALTRAGTLALLLFYAGLFALPHLGYFPLLAHFPRSVGLIQWMTLMLCLAAPRVAWRMMEDRSLVMRLFRAEGTKVPVLLVGATAQAEMFIRESERSINFPYRPVGIVDRDPSQRGRAIHHVRIYGGIHDLEVVIAKLVEKGHPAQRLLLTDPDLPRETYEQLLSIAEAHSLTIARLPSLAELKAGEGVSQIHPVAMEDILGRPQAVLDRDSMRKLIAGKRVLVTGAGGSIGSELTRQILAYGPAEILLYEQSEYLLYLIDTALKESGTPILRRVVIGDVRDAVQLHRIFGEFKPQIVFHAAAIKHVPMSEQNPEQAVLTNIMGSKQVADACVAHGVQAMVQVSTDKAVNPASVMGASKRAAEIYCQALAQQGAATHFITVRFGNVLNSAGSVVPLFQQQLTAGGPITVTHPEMTRYFMTIGEAVELVLQAAALGATGQDSAQAKIYVLDMGTPVAILALAERMIRLAGLRPYEDIDIVFTGQRPGEKLHEELFHAGESIVPTAHKNIRLAAARALDVPFMLAAMQAVIEAARAGERRLIPGLLQAMVPEYRSAS